MRPNALSWCDLSADRPEAAKAFYADLFGWRFSETRQADGTPYWIAERDGRAAAGLYATPERFQALQLPSFWMPYFHIADVDRSVLVAEERGGRLEVGPLALGGGATGALLRDPLGAGFTICDAADWVSPVDPAHPGRLSRATLHVSTAQAVRSFYEALFGWRVRKDPWAGAGAFRFVGAEGETVAHLAEIPDAMRGRYQYWSLSFGVTAVDAARAQVTPLGGAILVDHAGVLLAADPDGAAFMLTSVS